jgi:endonuclease/exonuclease/phosphatase (EEP) superfamily protein YafD
MTLTVTRIVSWNLLHLQGASVGDVAELIRKTSPDLMLMQEATREIDHVTDSVGGFYTRCPLPGRIHGLAMWTPVRPRHMPVILPIPPGSFVDRVSQIVDLGPFSVANVHLSHGQLLNRRQLHRIARELPHHGAIIGDFNLVGPCLLPGFHDIGPRAGTHRAGKMMPLRLDRCLARGLRCHDARALPYTASDHRPIMMELEVTL